MSGFLERSDRLKLRGGIVIPFRLNCPNCQSRIVVRFEHLLGQSLPCPKCQRTIAIPAQSPEPGPNLDATNRATTDQPMASRPQSVMPASMDSTAMTKEDYGDWDEVLANIPQNVHDLPESIDWGNPLGDGSTSQSNEATYIQPLGTVPAPRPSSTDRAWQSQSLAKRRQLLLVATIGVLSTVLAGLAFLGFLRSVSKPIAKDDTNNVEQKAEQKDEPKEVKDPPKESKELTPTELPTPTNPNDNVPSEEPPTQQPVEPTTEPMTVPVGNPSETANNLSIPANNTTSLDPTDKPSIEPPSTGAASSELSPSEVDKKLSDLFGPTGFGELLNTSSTLPESGFGKKLTSEDLEIDDVSEIKQALFHPAAKPLPLWNEVAESQKIDRLKFQDLSLPQVMDFFTRVTGIGITIDWVSFRVAGRDESMTLSGDLQKKSLKEILTELLSGQGLGIEIEDGFPIVRPLASEPPTPIATLDMTGFVPNGFEQKLAEQVIALWELEAKCDASAGKLVWKANASAIDVAKVQSTMQLLRNIATAKPEIGTEPKIETEPKVNSRLLFDPNEWKEGRSILTRKIDSSVVIPDVRSVSELLTIAAGKVDVDLLIDWKNAWQHGLAPKELEVSVLRNRTLLQVAGKYLDEFALELVPIDRKSILLTTESMRRQQYIVVPVRCTEDKLDEVKRGLRTLAPLSPNGQSLFKFDPLPGTTDQYLARICRPRLSQIDEPELESAFGW